MGGRSEAPMNGRSTATRHLSELIALLDRRQYDPACKVTLEGSEYRQLREAALGTPSETAGIAQVHPMPPQPETVTKATPATGTSYTIPGPWAPETSLPSAEQFLRTDEPRECPDCWGNGYTYGIPEGDKLPCSTCAETGKVVPYRTSSSAAEISEIEDALWALHSYESNRDDGGRVYTEANITQMVETVRSFRSPTPEAVRVAFDQVNKLAAELASLRSASGPMPAHPNDEQIKCLMGVDISDEYEARQVWQALVLAADSQTNAASTNSDGSRRGLEDALSSARSATRRTIRWKHVPVACHNLGINFMELRDEVDRIAATDSQTNAASTNTNMGRERG